MMLRIPVHPEVLRLRELPNALRALGPAKHALTRSEMSDAVTAMAFPEAADRDGFLACRMELRRSAAENFGAGHGLVVDGELDWGTVVERAAAREDGWTLPPPQAVYLSVNVPEHVAEAAYKEACRRMGETPRPRQGALRAEVGELVAGRVRAALQEGLRIHQEWQHAVETWDGHSKIPSMNLPIPEPVPEAGNKDRWTLEKVLGARVQAWADALNLPGAKILKDPLAVLVDGSVVRWVSLFWRATKSWQAKEWTPEQEKWIRAKIRELHASRVGAKC